MRRPIKIVRIIARLNIGGPAVNAAILALSLDRELFKTKVVYGTLAEGEGSLEHLMRDSKVDMELVPELGREIDFLDDFRAFFKILRILKRERPDIVHTHTAKAGTLGRLAAIFSGAKVKVHTFHGNVFRNYFGAFKTSFFVFIERTLGLFTTRIIAVSQKQKAELVEEFRIIPEGKCEVIPLGVDLSKLRDAAGKKHKSLREELGLADDPVVGIIGRLVPIKNHKMFLAAACEVRKQRPDLKARYVIIGGGELRGELERLAASLGMGGIVYFTGWREDLGNIYRNIDIVALTSLNEGTPLCLIEALAMGKAIIAANVGGVSDIIDDGVNGLLVGKDDINGFVEGLIRLLEDRNLRDSLGRNAVKKSEVFDKENLVKATARLYMECLRNG
ncbi:MAG: glycosyltransferase family 4 protein [Candidatus Omnitrophota bacterium]|nr:glycosyltransferase family 4 protein [Candidatus Omnitrophota bacterium]